MCTFCKYWTAWRNLLKFGMDVMPYVTISNLYPISPHIAGWNRDGCLKSRGETMTKPLAMTHYACARVTYHNLKWGNYSNPTWDKPFTHHEFLLSVFYNVSNIFNVTDVEIIPKVSTSLTYICFFTDVRTWQMLSFLWWYNDSSDPHRVYSITGLHITWYRNITDFMWSSIYLAKSYNPLYWVL
jgi:hypothetical protein